MDTTTEDQSVAAALSGAKEKFKALEEAEQNFAEGIEFGQAIIELRDAIRKSRGRNFKKTLEDEGITYAKARYWMDAVKGKPVNRGKAKTVAPRDAPFDWDAAFLRLEEFADDVEILKLSQPEGGEILDGPLSRVASMRGYALKEKEANA